MKKRNTNSQLSFHVLGSKGCGKTSLINYLLQKDRIQSLLGNTHSFQVNESSNQDYTIQNLNLPNYLILVYSIADSKTFNLCTTIYYNNVSIWKTFPTLVIGTHSDILPQARRVEITQAEEFASQEGLFFMEVSLTENTNLILTKTILEIQLEAYLERISFESSLEKETEFQKPSIIIPPRDYDSFDKELSGLSPASRIPQPTPPSVNPSLHRNLSFESNEDLARSSYGSDDDNPFKSNKFQKQNSNSQINFSPTSKSNIKKNSPISTPSTKLLHPISASASTSSTRTSSISPLNLHPISQKNSPQKLSFHNNKPKSISKNASKSHISTPPQEKSIHKTYSLSPNKDLNPSFDQIQYTNSIQNQPNNLIRTHSKENFISDDFINDKGVISFSEEMFNSVSPATSVQEDKFIHDLHRHSVILQNLKEIEEEMFSSESIRNYQETRDGFVIPVISTDLKSSQASNVIFSRRKKNIVNEKEKIHIDIQVGDGRVAHITVQDGDNIMELAKKLQLSYRLTNRTQHELAYLIQKAIRKHIDITKRSKSNLDKQEAFVLETEKRANTQRPMQEPLLKIVFERGNSKPGTVIVRKGSNIRELAKNFVNLYGLKKSMIKIVENQIQDELFKHYSNEAKSLFQKMIPKDDEDSPYEVPEALEEGTLQLQIEEENSNPKIIFNMEVEISKGNYSTFAVLEGDSPKKLAHIFASKHNLSQKSEQKLVKLIEHHLKEIS